MMEISCCVIERASDVVDDVMQEQSTSTPCQETSDENLDPQLWGKLQQDILGKIIARLPLKYMLQARVFSKAWSAKIFSPLFEREVASVSSSWPTYCPFYLLFDTLISYDTVTDGWQKIFSQHTLAYVPGGITPYTKFAGAGSLVCVLSEDEELLTETLYDRRWIHELRRNDWELFVTNLVLRQTRKLPRRPNMDCPHIMHVLPVDRKSYKVILVTQLMMINYPAKAPMCTQIYDSVTKSWTFKPFSVLLSTSLGSCSYVYLDGVLYFVIMENDPGNETFVHRLVWYDVEKGTWNSIILHSLPTTGFPCKVYLCGSDIMLVVTTAGVNTTGVDVILTAHSESQNKFHIFKLNLETLQVEEVSRGPPEMVVGAWFDQSAAHGDSIYFGGRYFPETPLLVYNVRSREWSCHTPAWNAPFSKNSLWRVWNGATTYSDRPMHFPWGNFALQPGLNPFVEV